MNERRLYLLGCLLYLSVNVIVLRVAGMSLWRDVIGFAIANALPPALLGIAVVRYYRAGVLRNIVLALAFAVISSALTTGIQWLTWPDRFRLHMEYVVWTALVALLLFVIIASGAHLHRVQLELARAESARARAELQALRARIDPHFLFNTLHSLLALVRQDPGRAEEAIEQFADILRYTFAAGDGSEERTLEQEWQLVDNYLALERLRLGARLRVEATLDADVARAPLPVLTLQPLVENAVRHAIAPRAAGGRIEIRGERCPRGVCLTVSDDGPGADPQKLDRAQGRGLQLVRERLERMYRGAATMEMTRSEAGGLRVKIELPFPA